MLPFLTERICAWHKLACAHSLVMSRLWVRVLSIRCLELHLLMLAECNLALRVHDLLIIGICLLCLIEVLSVILVQLIEKLTQDVL